MNTNAFPLMVNVVVTSAEQLQMVYAVLANGLAITTGPAVASERGTNQRSVQADLAAGVSGTAVAAADAATTVPAADVSGEVDAGGHPWSPDLHASTQTKTKDGYWRMKVGTSRPDPLPGFPKADGPSSSSASGAASEASTSATAPAASAATETGEDDEFAAFRQALDKGAVTDSAAAAAAPARKYTDADLGAVCNQAAVKLGDPAPVKALIADYIPEGVVAHSRNIPDDKRAEFVKAVETKAGIEFAG